MSLFVSVTVTTAFLLTVRTFLIVNRGLQNSCLILMMAVPWKKKVLVYVCFVVFGIVSVSAFKQFSLCVL